MTAAAGRGEYIISCIRRRPITIKLIPIPSAGCLCSHCL